MNFSPAVAPNLTPLLFRNHTTLVTPPLRLNGAIVGIPFYFDHIRDFSSQTQDGEDECSVTLMAVVVILQREAVLGDGKDHVAFVAQWTVKLAADDCSHQPKQVETSSCRDWKALARLDGFEVDSLIAGRSSLGNVMAVSPQGTRIALSDWAQLRVWALDPDALREEDHELHFPAEDICEEYDLAILRHVELPSRGVIHSMCWHDEDRLYAMTDRSLVSWDVGPRACGRAELLSSVFES